MAINNTISAYIKKHDFLWDYKTITFKQLYIMKKE